MIKKINLFEAFENAMKNNPEGSRKDQFAAFLATMRSNPVYLDNLARDYFDRMTANWAMEKDGDSHVLTGTAKVDRRLEVAAKQRAEKAAANKADIDKVRADFRASVKPFIWLEMIVNTSSGPKKVRHCTGAELARLGGAFTEMSKHLKPNQVVDKHLSEADLNNIWSRFGTSKRRAASGAELHA